MEHYHAVMYAQTAIDLASCLLIAGLRAPHLEPSRRVVGAVAGGALPLHREFRRRAPDGDAGALLHRARILCAGPFSGRAALDVGSGAGLRVELCHPAPPRRRAAGRDALPGHGLLWIPALGPGADAALGGRSAGLLSVLPFIAWTIRNERTFHVFQPLAPRYAVDPGEPSDPGFNRWTKTVCVDLTCTWEVYWNVNSDPIELANLPARAFDSPQQYEQTRELLDDYNRTHDAHAAARRRLRRAGCRAHPRPPLPLLCGAAAGSAGGHGLPAAHRVAVD